MKTTLFRFAARGMVSARWTLMVLFCVLTVGRIAAEEPQKKSGEGVNAAVSGFFDRFTSPKAKEASSKPEDATPLEKLLPNEALMILRTAPVGRLNKSVGHLLGQVGLGELAPLDWLKISPYGKVLASLDRKRSLGLVWMASKSKTPALILYVPVLSGDRFIETLGISGENDDTIKELTKPEGWLCASKNGYVLLTNGANRSPLERALNARPFSQKRFTPPALKDPDVSLEMTERGIPYLSGLGVSAAKPFLRLLARVGTKKETAAEQQKLTERFFGYLELFREESGKNLRALRIDGVIANDALLTAFSFVPQPGSPLSRQIADRGGLETPTSLETGFLKVVPNVPSALCGQTDIAPEIASELEPPFNRLRHVEYAFPPPNEGHPLAESWCFFLEVDDSEAFIRELVVPKARKIGEHIGSESLGELGAKLLGNMATRRQARGRQPIIGTPKEAAALGGEFGSALGAQIGSAVGESEATKMSDFEGYWLLETDLALYIRQMREINALESGEKTREPVLLTGEPTLRLLIGQMLSGLESGSLDGIIRNKLTSAAGELALEDEVPLLAVKNFFLILDSRHLLVVPGDKKMLRAAKNRWQDYQQVLKAKEESDEAHWQDYLLALQAKEEAEGARWRPYWDLICEEMENPKGQTLRGAARFDPPVAQRFVDCVRNYYAPGLPKPFAQRIKPEMPPILSISTTSKNAAVLSLSLPTPLAASAVELYREKILPQAKAIPQKDPAQDSK